jgi:CheY-like chemotaxis protein
MSGLMKGAKVDLTAATVMLIDPHPHGMSMLVSIFQGFDVRAPMKYVHPDAALAALKDTPVDLIVVEGEIPGTSGYVFTKALRHSGLEPNRHAPVIIVTAHALMSTVIEARDCGANFVILKPLTPKAMLDRITWVTKAPRTFIESPQYIGPDRRFQRLGPPFGMRGRRVDDVPADLGEATEENMSQADIDAMMPVQRITL